jgi:hypothetical protein
MKQINPATAKITMVHAGGGLKLDISPFLENVRKEADKFQ